MATTSELQAALIPLAEKAGERLWQDHGMCPKGHDVDNCTKNWIVFPAGSRVPGADGTLTDAECWTVLGWLAKAGYMFQMFIVTGGNIDGQFSVTLTSEHSGSAVNSADTLNAALAAAVLALHEAKA